MTGEFMGRRSMSCGPMVANVFSNVNSVFRWVGRRLGWPHVVSGDRFVTGDQSATMNALPSIHPDWSRSSYPLSRKMVRRKELRHMHGAQRLHASPRHGRRHAVLPTSRRRRRVVVLGNPRPRLQRPQQLVRVEDDGEEVGAPRPLIAVLLPKVAQDRESGPPHFPVDPP